MTFLKRLFHRHRNANPVTVFARQRLDRTMPGETAALTAARLGFLVN